MLRTGKEPAARVRPFGPSEWLTVNGYRLMDASLLVNGYRLMDASLLVNGYRLTGASL